MRKQTHFILFFAILAVFAFGIYQGEVKPVEALNPDLIKYTEVYGWAWSGNSAGTDGIGWISFNSKNCASGGIVSPVCGGGDEKQYRVYFDKSAASGRVYFHGYAWVGNGGKNPGYAIKFGPVSSTAADRTISDSAVTFDKEWVYFDTATKKLKGWARTCSVFNDKNNCGDGHDKTLDPNAGGWDGWINMSGTNYEVFYNNNSSGGSNITAKDCKNTSFPLEPGQFGGCAWGGGNKNTDPNYAAQIPGWISFSWADGDIANSSTYNINDPNNPNALTSGGSAHCINGGVCSSPDGLVTNILSASCNTGISSVDVGTDMKWTAFANGGSTNPSTTYFYKWITPAGWATSTNSTNYTTGNYTSAGNGSMNVLACITGSNPPVCSLPSLPCKNDLGGNGVTVMSTSGRAIAVSLDPMSAKFTSDSVYAYKTGGLTSDLPRIKIESASPVDPLPCLPVTVINFAIKNSGGYIFPVDGSKYSSTTQSLNSLGYKGLNLYLKGKINWPAGLYNVSFNWGSSCNTGKVENIPLKIEQSGGTFQEF